MASERQKGSERREPTFDASTRPRSKSSERRLARRGRRNGGGRSPIRRLFYWGLVLGLWAVIIGAGTLVLVAATLPPIQSLEIPKRPASIEIVGTDGKPLATRGEWHGTTVQLKDLPPYMP